MGCVRVLFCTTFECVSVHEVASQWARSSGKGSQLLSGKVAVLSLHKAQLGSNTRARTRSNVPTHVPKCTVTRHKLTLAD